MLDKKIILFIILLLGLLFCSFLGGSRCSREGFKDASNNTTDDSSATSSNSKYNDYKNQYYNQSTTDQTNSNSNDVPPPNNQTQDTITEKSFYGPNGGNAKVVNMNGTYYIRVTDQTGTSTDYTTSDNNPPSPSPPPPNNQTQDIYGITFTGDSGGEARVINNNGSIIIEVSYPSGEKLVFTQNGAGIYNPNSSYKMVSMDSTLNNGSQYPSGSTSAYYYPSTTSGTSESTSTSMNSTGEYDSTMPPGVPKSQIPEGDEDLYILKSQVIAPVCPACPVASACPKKDAKAPPCPACARCPESNFECKKVPNYNNINDTYLPMPVLNSFSTFGM